MPGQGGLLSVWLFAPAHQLLLQTPDKVSAASECNTVTCNMIPTQIHQDGRVNRGHRINNKKEDEIGPVTKTPYRVKREDLLKHIQLN